ncbi:unnamed protein product [Linum trigynum]|uniref:Uncharacterized protein n=1 Tax=Linum trigynum TaxID=586398 RepID=A0AAV2GMM0_9ROSI
MSIPDYFTTQSSNRSTPSQSYLPRDWNYAQVLTVDVDMLARTTGDVTTRRTNPRPGSSSVADKDPNPRMSPVFKEGSTGISLVDRNTSKLGGIASLALSKGIVTAPSFLYIFSGLCSASFTSLKRIKQWALVEQSSTLASGHLESGILPCSLLSSFGPIPRALHGMPVGSPTRSRQLTTERGR